MSVRTMCQGERLPEGLRTGYEGGRCDPNWIFLVERDGKPVSILVAAPVHIVVLLVRMVSTPEAHVNDIRSLLVYFVKTVKERGYSGYITYLGLHLQQEKALADIIKAAGGTQIEEPQFLCVGTV